MWYVVFIIYNFIIYNLKIIVINVNVQGREEEFVAFVFDKYDVPYELMPKYILDPVPGEETETEISTTTTAAEIDPNSTTNPTNITNNENENGNDLIPDPDSQEESSELQSARVPSVITEKTENESITKSNPSKIKENIVVILHNLFSHKKLT